MKIEPILWPRINKNNKHFIKIRITENRLSKYVNTKYDVSERYWNENTHRVRTTQENHKEINDAIELLLVRYRIEKPNKLKQKKPSYLEYYKRELEYIRNSNRYNDHRKHKVILNHLEKFIIKKYKKEDILFDDITIDFLQNLKIYFVKKGHIKNTIKYNIGKIKFFYNKAIRERFYKPEYNPFDNFKLEGEAINNRGLVLKEFLSLEALNPFYFNKISKRPDTLRSQKTFYTKNYFLIQFYSSGMRVSDLLMLRWKNINDGFLQYQMRKTNKEIKLPLNHRLLEILRFFMPLENKLEILKHNQNDIELYLSLTEAEKKYMGIAYPEIIIKNKNHNKQFYNYEIDFHNQLLSMYNGLGLLEHKEIFIINILTEKEIKQLNKKTDPHISTTTHKIIQSNTARYNKRLKNIVKLLQLAGATLNVGLTTHTSRHTFAGVMVNKDTNLSAISKSLGHSTIKTTEMYIKSLTNEFIYDEINKTFISLESEKQHLIENTNNLSIQEKPSLIGSKVKIKNNKIVVEPILIGTIIKLENQTYLIYPTGKKGIINLKNIDISKYNEGALIGTIIRENHKAYIIYTDGKKVIFNIKATSSK